MTLFDPEPARIVEPTVRVRMVLAYDGTPFHGYAENPGVRSVAGTLREALERVLGHVVELTGAGRTDRGVHAAGQVVSFATRMDGFDLTRNVRADARLKGVPIIMITSRTADKHRTYASELGVNVFLGKPYQEEELLQHIAAFVGRS